MKKPHRKHVYYDVAFLSHTSIFERENLNISFKALYMT